MKLPIWVRRIIIKIFGRKKLNSIKYRPGLNLYSLNIYTGEIEQIRIEKNQKTGRFKSQINQKNIHVWALNEENAIRKFTRIVNQFEK